MTTSDIQLIIKCQDGDQAAFKTLVEKHQSYAYTLAFRLLWHQQDAEDIVQEAFVRVWKHIGRFERQKKFTTWLWQIVVRLCYDCLKSRKRKKRFLSFQSNDLNPDHLISVEQSDQHNERLYDLKKALKNLSPKQKLVFTLRDLHDFSIDQVVSLTGLSPGSVKTNLYHARKSIRKQLTSDEVNNDLSSL
ncbi:sigma-70 family RNA polymerase sigma factor [candidate division KSB1 bacterium]|nr:sigma-70 family RNA polymerase sigma factor [candidate division KSB1 bacterium]